MSHHAAATISVVLSSSRFTATAVIAARAVASAPVRRTVRRSRSVKGTLLPRELVQQRQPAFGAVDGQVGLFGHLRRRLRREDAHADRGAKPSLLAQLAQAPAGVEVGAIVAGVDGGLDLLVGEQRSDRGVLAPTTDRPQLEHLAAPARFQLRPTGGCGDLAGAGLGGAL